MNRVRLRTVKGFIKVVTNDAVWRVGTEVMVKEEGPPGDGGVDGGENGKNRVSLERRKQRLLLLVGNRGKLEKGDEKEKKSHGGKGIWGDLLFSSQGF